MSPVVATFVSAALFAAPCMLTAREGAGSAEEGRGRFQGLATVTGGAGGLASGDAEFGVDGAVIARRILDTEEGYEAASEYRRANR